MAASLVLLIVAGLCVRSIGGARTIDPGFRTDHRVVLSFSPTLVRVRRRALGGVLPRPDGAGCGRLPSVESATVARFVPLDFNSGGGATSLSRAGRPKRRPGPGRARRVVDDQYFRDAGDADRARAARSPSATRPTSLPVVIVNETMARTSCGRAQNPIGKRLQYDIPNGPFLEVVGMVADGKYRQLTENPRPYIFLPFAQNPRATVHGRRVVPR